MIKNIFIMKGNTGELIFYKTYEDIFNVKLTSSFLSAIFSFVKQTLKTEELSEIEVGLFRFIFEIEKVGNDELLFALFSDRTDNLVELRNQLREIKKQFMNKYDLALLTKNFDGEISKFFEFDKNINEIMENHGQLVSDEIKKELLNVFNELHTFSSFVVSSALLTQTGRVIVSSLEPNILSEIIRLLEGRFISGNYRVNELVSLENFGVLSLTGIDQHFISVIQFKSNCPFETGLVISKRFSNRIQKLIC
jgi:6-pyruvoyl-tetrahydropterin synthase